MMNQPPKHGQDTIPRYEPPRFLSGVRLRSYRRECLPRDMERDLQTSRHIV